MKGILYKETKALDYFDLENTSLLKSPQYDLGRVVKSETKTIAGGRGCYSLVTYETGYKGRPAWITILDIDSLSLNVHHHYYDRKENARSKLARKIQEYVFGYPSCIGSFVDTLVVPEIYDIGIRKESISVKRNQLQIKLEGLDKFGLEDKTFVYMVSEPLNDELDSPMKIDDAIVLFRNLAKGLKILHDNQIYHNLINPNAVIGSKESPKLVNFFDIGRIELGWTIQTNPSPEKYAEWVFLAPEQIKEEVRKWGDLADVYSLGATLYYTITGKPLIDPREIDILKIITKIVNNDVEIDFPDELENDARSKKLITVVKSSIEKDLKKRINLDGFISGLDSL